MNIYCDRYRFQPPPVLRDGSLDGQPTKSTMAMNSQAAQAASNAKMKTLPALQVNQDPFGTWSALTLMYFGFGIIDIFFIMENDDEHM